MHSPATTRLLEQVRPGTVKIYDTDQRKASGAILAQDNFAVQQHPRYDTAAFDILQQRLLEYTDALRLESHE